MALKPETKEEKLRDLFQIMQSNLELFVGANDIFVRAEIKETFEKMIERAVKILEDRA